MKKQAFTKSTTVRRKAVREIAAAELSAVSGGNNPIYKPLGNGGSHSDSMPSGRTTHPNHNSTRMSIA